VAALFLVQLVTSVVFVRLFAGGMGRVQPYLIGFAYATTTGWLAYVLLPVVSRRTRDAAPLLRWFLILAASAIVGAVAMLATTGLLVLVGVLPAHQLLSAVRHSTLPSATLAMVIGGLWSFYESLDLRRRLAESEARMKSLEARLHPHFLFNTLNSIAALIPDDPAAAEHMVVKLAALLRYSLQRSGRPAISLADEVAMVREYFAIERIRHGDRVDLHIDVPESLLPCQVPPFALQTLLENALKHGSPPLRIAARFVADRVQIDVEDAGRGFSAAQMAPGHGLHDLRERLKLLWGSRASLSIDSGEGRCIVRLTMPFVAATLHS
jgi:signal transduction histidine kinase